MFKLNSLNSLRALRDLHASQSAGVRALTTCSPLILKQRNPLLSLSLRRRLPSHRRTICMSFETSRAAVISDLDCRMERMKNNCRKAAMETRQQQIQVDLGRN